MPELPEVETIRKILENDFKGRTLHSSQLYNGSLRYPLHAEDLRLLHGKRLESINRHGKYLFFEFEKKLTLLQHLGMSGKLLSLSAISSIQGKEWRRHAIFSLYFSEGMELLYNDPRRFGFSFVGPLDKVLSKKAKGKDPLEKDFNPGYLESLQKRHHKSIKSVLMDQAILAGIGNIYANEILFCARQHPRMSFALLSNEELVILAKCIRSVLTEAIRFQGSSISDYLDSKGKKGRFQKRFQVYNRDGLECRNCGSRIERKRELGRSYYFCPLCQIEPEKS